MRLPRSLRWRLFFVLTVLVFVCVAIAGSLMALLAFPFQAGGAPPALIITLSSLGAATLTGAMAYLLGKGISGSILQVTDGARRLAQGDLGHRLPASQECETRELAATLNTMANALRGNLQELAAERNKLSAILESMADGVVMIDQEGRIVHINQVAGDLLNLDISRVPERRFIEVARNVEMHQLVARSTESGESQHEEIQLSAGRYVSVIAIPLGEGSSSTGVILTLHDLTRLRQVDVTRREFVSNVSHEFRSPLASIKAAVETLEDGALDEPGVARDFVGRIHKDTNRLIGLADNLLELSKLESGQLSWELHPVTLSPFLEEVRDSFSAHAQAKDISIMVEVHDVLPQVMAHEEYLRQVLTNLLDNAVKFTPNGGEIRVRADVRDSLVEVQVCNTGPGIPREHLPHLFERFYKVDRSRHDGGVGLGLAIVMHMVHHQGGEVGVESEEGQGASFSFTIPRAG